MKNLVHVGAGSVEDVMGLVSSIKCSRDADLEIRELLVVMLWDFCVFLRKLFDQLVEWFSPFVSEIRHCHGIISEGQVESESDVVEEQEVERSTRWK